MHISGGGQSRGTSGEIPWDGKTFDEIVAMGVTLVCSSPGHCIASGYNNNELDVIGDSANCCTRSYSAPETCPPSSVQCYDFFSALFYSSPHSRSIYSTAHPLKRKPALTPTSTLMMRAAKQLCGPASRSTTATTPLFSAPKPNKVKQQPIPKFFFSCSSPLCRGDAVVHYKCFRGMVSNQCECR